MATEMSIPRYASTPLPSPSFEPPASLTLDLIMFMPRDLLLSEGRQAGHTSPGSRVHKLRYKGTLISCIIVTLVEQARNKNVY